MLAYYFFDQSHTTQHKTTNFSAYQPVEPSDLWEALEAVSENEISILPTNVTLSEVMENWIETSGYPVVNVTLNSTNIVMAQVPALYHTSVQKSTKCLSSNDF